MWGIRSIFLIGVSLSLLDVPGVAGTGLRYPGTSPAVSSDSTAVDSAQIPARRPDLGGRVSGVTYAIERDFFTNLPARGIEPAILIQPGVMSQGTNAFGEPLVSMRGGREGEVEYRLDGVPVNDLLLGGRAVSITAEAVEEIQVQPGGPAAGIGTAGSGLVGIQLRTGRGDRWGGSLIAETDRYAGMNTMSLGGYSYGYSDWTGTAGGPFPGLGNVLRIFGSVQNTFYRDPTVSVRSGYNFSGANAVVTDPIVTPNHSMPRPDTLNLVLPGGNALGGQDNRWTLTGTALLDLSPMEIKLSGSYSRDRSQTPTVLENLLNQSRLPLNIAQNGFLNARITHTLSPALSYDAGISYASMSVVTEDPQLLDNLFAYGDPAANAAIGYTLQSIGGQSANWPAYQLWNGAFTVNQPGTQTAGFGRTSQESFSGRAGFTIRWNDQVIKLGGEYTRYTLRTFAPQDVFSWWGVRKVLPDPASLEIALLHASLGTNSYGYDVYGRETNSDDIRGGSLYTLGPRRPVVAGGYVQDDFAVSSFSFDLGLRFDYLDPALEEVANPASLQFSSNNLLLASQLVNKGSTTQFSPRIGVSLPVTGCSVLFARFGRYIEETSSIAPGFDPAAVTQYEIGYSSDVGDFATIGVAGFYKTVSNQVSVFEIGSREGVTNSGDQVFQEGRSNAAYLFVQGNRSFSPKGLELSFVLRRTARLAARASYTLQDVDTKTALGLTGASSLGGIVTTAPTAVDIPEFNSVHRGSVLLDYRFGKDDGGAIFEQSGLNLMMTFSSGHTFPTQNLFYPGLSDPRFVVPTEPVNSSSTRWFFQLDARIDRAFPVGPVGLDVYLYAINLLGTDNPVDVFARSGDPSNDGWLSSAGGQVEALVNGPQYVAFYNGVNNGKNSGNWGPPRQIRFGVRLDY